MPREVGSVLIGEYRNSRDQKNQSKSLEVLKAPNFKQSRYLSISNKRAVQWAGMPSGDSSVPNAEDLGSDLITRMFPSKNASRCTKIVHNWLSLIFRVSGNSSGIFTSLQHSCETPKLRRNPIFRDLRIALTIY